MSKPVLAVVVAAAVLVGLSAGIVVAGVPNGGAGYVNYQRVQYSTNDKPKNAPNQWKTFPGLDLDLNDLGGSTQVLGLVVSADMRKGKANVRVEDANGSIAIPGRVQFAGRGSNAYTFLLPTGDGGGGASVQWRRVGDAKAKAASFAVHAIGFTPN